MSVGVCKAVLIHESIILGLVVGGAAGSYGFGDEVLNLRAALTTEAKQNFGGFGRVADGFGCEAAELVVREQHDENRLADDDACGGIVREPGIVLKAESMEKRHRL